MPRTLLPGKSRDGNRRMTTGQTIDIPSVMETLAQNRPVFHSESDFKHALSWQIQQDNPAMGVRQEVGNLLPGPDRRYVDIWFPDTRTAIELKYRTTPATIQVEGEEFDLRRQGATLIRRYDFWHDVARLERAVLNGMAAEGFAISLTNDHLYWDMGKPDTFDQQFRVHEGREASGTLAWAPGTASGTTKTERVLWKSEVFTGLSGGNTPTPKEQETHCSDT